jgi:hypothetical protein
MIKFYKSKSVPQLWAMDPPEPKNSTVEAHGNDRVPDMASPEELDPLTRERQRAKIHNSGVVPKKP